MRFVGQLRPLARAAASFIAHPVIGLRRMTGFPEWCKAGQLAASWRETAADQVSNALAVANPLLQFFESRREGRGIWKWTHYFDVYHRHLQKFVGTPVHVVEIGVYGGGSLEMWKSYFGRQSRITGIDIIDACKAYEDRQADIHILIGDQEDREFWRRAREQIPPVDVVIDDGGHTPEQQRVTLEEMLPRLRPGGVYICEDVHAVGNRFGAYAQALAAQLNEMVSETTPFQRDIQSVHFYPYLVVIERSAVPVRIESVKRGSDWPG
jgi:hypothetical protein